MDQYCVAMLLFCVFYVKKSAECNNDDIFAMAGCDVSFNWTLGNTPSKTIHAIIYHSSNKIAQLIEDECRVTVNVPAYCSTSDYDDEWIVYLTIFNVTEHRSGNYSIGFLGPGEAKNLSSKTLMVIGKPKITELRKPILHQLFEMNCGTPFGLQYFAYRWKINGSEITPVRFANANYVSSLRMTDNFSQVTCQVCLNETASNFSSEICKHDGCSEDSDPYEMKVIYGPDNISLSLKESHFYLKEYEPFTIDCFANCGPKCFFSWKGHDIFEGEKLVITNFESRKAGEYTCYVTNQETNITSKSNPIILQKEKEDKLKVEAMGDLPLMQYWMGLVIVSVLLLFVGCSILVTHWRKSTTRSIDSRELCQPCVGQTNSEMSETRLGSSSRSLPSRAAQENVSRRTKRIEHPNIQRHSGSLQNLSNQTEPFMNQVRENVPLRTLFQASHTTHYQTANSAYSDNPPNNRSSFGQDNWPCIMGRSAPGSRLVKLFTRIKRKNKVPRDDHNIGAGSRGLNNLREDHFEPKLHEDPYSTIDEDAMSVYDHGIDNLIENYSHETGRSTEHLFYDYAHSTEIYHVETADVHVTDETYITPISDLCRPSEIFQDEDTDVLGTDETYITPIIDLAPPIEPRENGETNVLGTDQTYLTTINDFANPIEICQGEETDMIETDTTYKTKATV